jgi:hypothetical protein
MELSDTAATRALATSPSDRKLEPRLEKMTPP